MPDDARYGTWCFDCHKPALAADFVTAIAIAIRAGWRLIRGVWRCPECAACRRNRDRGQAMSDKELEVAIPPNFFSRDEFVALCANGGFLNAAQCARLWRMTDRQGVPPGRLQVLFNREDLMREFPPPPTRQQRRAAARKRQ
jgi:hypothetical protein